MRFNELPADLKEQIIGELGNAKWILNAGLSCKTLYEVSKYSNSIWKSLFLHEFDDPVRTIQSQYCIMIDSWMNVYKKRFEPIKFIRNLKTKQISDFTSPRDCVSALNDLWAFIYRPDGKSIYCKSLQTLTQIIVKHATIGKFGQFLKFCLICSSRRQLAADLSAESLKLKATDILILFHSHLPAKNLRFQLNFNEIWLDIKDVNLYDRITAGQPYGFDMFIEGTDLSYNILACLCLQLDNLKLPLIDLTTIDIQQHLNGSWIGLYSYFSQADQYDLKFTVELKVTAVQENGDLTVSGGGTDKIGSFGLEGVFSQETRRIDFWKAYENGPRWKYRMKLLPSGIFCGTWGDLFYGGSGVFVKI